MRRVGVKPRTRRFRLNVPTPVIVTLLGVALIVWVAPAFIRQWDDRQEVRELKTALADEIATATASTLAAGLEIGRAERGRAARPGAIRDAQARWEIASLRMSVRLRAYLGGNTEAEWATFAANVTHFLAICEAANPRTESAFFVRRLKRFVTRRVFIESSLEPIDEALGSVGLRGIAGGAGPRDLSKELVSWDSPTLESSLALETVKRAMVVLTERVTTAVLAAHPSGFSTTRRDLLRDLLP
jgi:hypothetical protein